MFHPLGAAPAGGTHVDSHGGDWGVLGRDAQSDRPPARPSPARRPVPTNVRREIIGDILRQTSETSSAWRRAVSSGRPGQQSPAVHRADARRRPGHEYPEPARAPIELSATRGSPSCPARPSSVSRSTVPPRVRSGRSTPSMDDRAGKSSSSSSCSRPTRAATVLDPLEQRQDLRDPGLRVGGDVARGESSARL